MCNIDKSYRQNRGNGGCNMGGSKGFGRGNKMGGGRGNGN